MTCILERGFIADEADRHILTLATEIGLRLRLRLRFGLSRIIGAIGVFSADPGAWRKRCRAG